MTRTVWKSLLGLAVALGLAGSAQAQLIYNDYYGQPPFVNGVLAGQGAYINDGPVLPDSVIVNGGLATIAPGLTANTQDVVRPFTNFVFGPGQENLYSAFRIQVTPSGVNGQTNFFLAWRESASGSGFSNMRFAVRGIDATTFDIGFRITGQGANPFVFGAPLQYGLFYDVIMNYEQVAGADNDVARVYVNFNTPFDLIQANNTPYVSQTNAAVGGDAASFDAFRFSPFGSAANPSPGANLFMTGFAGDWQTAITSVPEPTTMALAGIGMAGLAYGVKARRARRRKSGFTK